MKSKSDGNILSGERFRSFGSKSTDPVWEQIRKTNEFSAMAEKVNKPELDPYKRYFDETSTPHRMHRSHSTRQPIEQKSSSSSFSSAKGRGRSRTPRKKNKSKKKSTPRSRSRSRSRSKSRGKASTPKKKKLKSKGSPKKSSRSLVASSRASSRASEASSRYKPTYDAFFSSERLEHV